MFEWLGFELCWYCLLGNLFGYLWLVFLAFVAVFLIVGYLWHNIHKFERQLFDRFFRFSIFLPTAFWDGRRNCFICYFLVLLGCSLNFIGVVKWLFIKFWNAFFLSLICIQQIFGLFVVHTNLLTLCIFYLIHLIRHYRRI